MTIYKDKATEMYLQICRNFSHQFNREITKRNISFNQIKRDTKISYPKNGIFYGFRTLILMAVYLDFDLTIRCRKKESSTKWWRKLFSR